MASSFSSDFGADCTQFSSPLLLWCLWVLIILLTICFTCAQRFLLFSLSLQFQFCIIVISSLQNVSSSLSSLVVCFLKNSFMSARLTCSSCSCSCSSSWILCVLHLCCGVYITNPGKNFISLFENRSWRKAVLWCILSRWFCAVVWWPLDHD